MTDNFQLSAKLIINTQEKTLNLKCSSSDSKLYDSLYLGTFCQRLVAIGIVALASITW